MDLPDKLEDAFAQLARGRHISSVDGEVFTSLSAHTGRYREIFAALGFEFIADPHGFYYFNGSKKGLAKGVEQYALFTYIMIDWLSDNDHGVEDGLFGVARPIRDLPHLKSERYRGYLRQIGGDDEVNLNRIISNMERAGFVRQNADRIQFLSPTRRILKVCLDLAKRTTRADGASPANEGEQA
ncbi:hypothetical protein ACFQ3P_25945 [Paraburkholderia sabiae]|uniref:DUF4375 domain-containing protein n=1 Tax=Paraburkholderia sabiae TaxID=273251 RepID=A0ABU9QMC2_9BURK|nr:hypothetical protein [Paraburkholderia sabiae]WJZ77353.1 hypothetical protein QEN71_35375 [Paraburkholderia sabiae]CAD6547691.1 hypothetical protein LMG24235_04465 [Paraburkholderia sabiae]